MILRLQLWNITGATAVATLQVGSGSRPKVGSRSPGLVLDLFIVTLIWLVVWKMIFILPFSWEVRHPN